MSNTEKSFKKTAQKILEGADIRATIRSAVNESEDTTTLLAALQEFAEDDDPSLRLETHGDEIVVGTAKWLDPAVSISLSPEGQTVTIRASIESPSDNPDAIEPVGAEVEVDDLAGIMDAMRNVHDQLIELRTLQAAE